MSDSRARDVQIAAIGPSTQILRSRTWDRLKFEVEYARQKGTTANSYLIQAEKNALIDPPGSSFTELFIEELHQHQYFQKLDYVILSHVNQNRLGTLKQLLQVSPQMTIVCSKPAAIALKAAFDRNLNLHIVRDDETLDLGNGHVLHFAFIPTPRWVDALGIFDEATQILYTDKLFGAHVCDDSIFDDHWKQLDEDRHYYFDCLHAAQSKQVEAALNELEKFPAKLYAVGHGPVVRYSRSRLTLDYRDWCDEQKNQERSVALLYASAYGNTASVAQAIAKGLTDSEVTVEAVNCEFAEPSYITDVIERCDGFIIGTPTLAGHAPTQIQTALGLVLANASKTKVAGVFGSYGWSGEAIDLVESRLQDSGYIFGFDTLRVKFKPDETVLQNAEKAGVDFAQVLRKTKKVREPRPSTAETQSDRTAQALGRVIGSLSVVTVQQGEKSIGFLTSWLSQATFNPPGVTVAIAKSRAEGWLDHIGDSFMLNILKDDRQLQRTFAKQNTIDSDRLAELSTASATQSGPILLDALAYLECKVQNRMECGDHWLLYATVENGKVLESKGITAVLHRKSGTSY